MSKKIDDSLSKDLIALNMKKSKQEVEALRAMEAAEQRKANRAIDEAARFDAHGLSDTKDRDGKFLGVWEAASTKADEILNSSSFKGYDDFRSAMISLLGLYTDLNAALFYSVGELMPGLIKAVAGDYYDGFSVKADEIGSTLHEWKKDFCRWFVKEKPLDFLPNFLQPDLERGFFSHNMSDEQRSLIVDDLINIVDYNPNAGKDKQFHGPIAKLPVTDENKEKVNEFKAVFNESIKAWLGQHGYTQSLVNGKAVYKNGDDVLDKKKFDELRYHPVNGLKNFLSQDFAEDLTHHITPRI